MNIGNIKTRLFNKGLSLSLRALNGILPKKSSRMVFASLPDYSDNSKGLWEYVRNLSEYEAIWVTKSKELAGTLSEDGLACYYQYSWKGIISILTAKYIVCTHSQYIDIKSRKQLLINLWHGMPLKAMGFLDNSCNKKDIKAFMRASRKSDIMIATSSLMKYVMASCFSIDPRKVFVTGQPRNDLLFRPVDKSNTGKILGGKAGQYEKYILYCPTFRLGMGRIEGKKFSGNVFNFSDYNKSELDNILKAHKALLVIKLHPFEEKQYGDNELDLPDNAILVRSDVFNCNMLSIYDILALFDILITDYSSIYFDYLLLDKPIIFTANDLKEYKSGRGLVFDNYDFWAPGPKACSFPELVSCLTECLTGENYYKQERAIVNELVNSHTDGNSAGRVVDILKKLQ